MSDYLDEATKIVRAPAPLRDMLRQNRAGTINALVECLGSPNIMVRKYSAFALGQIGETGVIEILRSAYGSEQPGGAKDAMGAAIIALLEVPDGATDHIRGRAVSNVYHRRPWDFGLQDSLAANQAPIAGAYAERVTAEINAAPDAFKRAFVLMSQGNLDGAAQAFSACVAFGGEGITDDWANTASCCSAYCVAETGDFEGALMLAELGKGMCFRECGAYYYFSAMWNALNQLDRLPEALAIANDGVAYFTQRSSAADVAVHLGRKANILKQMASHLSRSPEPQRARPVITEAIKSYCDSLSITTAGWNDGDAEELDGMSRIAARVGISRRDLAFLDAMPRVDALVRRFFARGSG